MLIPLTQGQFAIVDAEDYEFLNQWKWYAERAENTFYAVRDIRVDGKKKNVRMHRLVDNTPAGLFTDHIDGNGLNNTKKNLRPVTHQENMINNKRWKQNKSGHRGVSWHKTEKMWYAQITVNSKNIYIGRFHEISDAVAAYEKKRSEVRANQITREEPAYA